VELTGRTADDALVALHDSDYDLNGAVEQLLENENDQVSYVASSRKMKSVENVLCVRWCNVWLLL